ncbi:MAG: hypothetical protein ACD_22C00232G0001 [uncultured bacterium]|nr:MAG: hypothetical protein ACD_22C00232G0001 [uncultured bacterium]
MVTRPFYLVKEAFMAKVTKLKKETKGKNCKAKAVKKAVKVGDDGVTKTSLTVGEAQRQLQKQMDRVASSKHGLGKNADLGDIASAIVSQELMMQSLQVKGDGAYTALAIEQGKLLIKLKEAHKKPVRKLSKKSKKKTRKVSWEKFLVTHVPGLSVRSCQERMKLAKRDDALDFASLGYANLLKYCRATERLYATDRLGEVLETLGIDPESMEAATVDEWRQKVLKKLPVAQIMGVAPELNHKEVKGCMLKGIKINAALLKKLDKATKNGDDPLEVLNTWETSGSDNTTSSESALKRFTKWATGTQETLKEIIESGLTLGQAERKIANALRLRLKKYLSNELLNT